MLLLILSDGLDARLKYLLLSPVRLGGSSTPEWQNLFLTTGLICKRSATPKVNIHCNTRTHINCCLALCVPPNEKRMPPHAQRFSVRQNVLRIRYVTNACYKTHFFQGRRCAKLSLLPKAVFYGSNPAPFSNSRAMEAPSSLAALYFEIRVRC